MKKTGLLAVVILMLFSAGAARAAEDEALMAFAEAYGAVQGMTLYNSQIVLGLMADAYAYEVYTAEEATQIIAEQKGFLEVQKNYINNLLALPEVAEDPQFFNDMVACIEKLLATAEALETFIGDPSSENADDFETKRQVSYGAISELLDL